MGDNFLSARKTIEFRMENDFDLSFHFENTVGFVVLSTVAIFMYCSLLVSTTLFTSLFINVGGVN